MRRAERRGSSVLDPVVVRDQPLVHQVEGAEPQVVLADVEWSDGLTRRQPLQSGNEDLDDKAPPGSRCLAALRKHSTCWSWVSRQVMAL
jgi:hypothetical protein